MIIAFVIWSVVSVIFLGIGISCRKSENAVGFFTFTKPPYIENVKSYNNAVSMLWFSSAIFFEILGIPFLFLGQNSPLFIPIVFGVIIWLISLMVVYMRIESKYRK